MKPGLLDINDCNLQLWHADQHLQSPGYAMFANGEFRFGTAAQRTARLKPRDINTRFWSQLSTEPLQPSLGSARHTADLAHAHLNSLYSEAGRPDELVLCVPGSMARAQLSLLLGIVASCPFNAAGLVHRSTALASVFGTADTTFHLEIQLHQSLLTKLVSDGKETRLERSTVLPGVGQLQLQERLVEVLADAFLKQTRFDPRRQAVTEQQLYDALPEALRTLPLDTETNVEINGYIAHIERRDVEQVAQPLYDSIAKHVTQGALLADPLAGLLPALSNAFPEVTVLQWEDVRQAIESQGDAVVQRAEHLDFITSLPYRSDSRLQQDRQPITAAMPRQQQQSASHLLVGHSARPLNTDSTPLGAGWSLAHTGGNWQLQGSGATIHINGEPAAAGQAVFLGDEIALGDDAPATLINVQS